MWFIPWFKKAPEPLPVRKVAPVKPEGAREPRRVRVLDLPKDQLIDAYCDNKKELILIYADSNGGTYEFYTNRYSWLWNRPELLMKAHRYQKEWFDSGLVFGTQPNFGAERMRY